MKGFAAVSPPPSINVCERGPGYRGKGGEERRTLVSVLYQGKPFLYYYYYYY